MGNILDRLERWRYMRAAVLIVGLLALVRPAHGSSIGNGPGGTLVTVAAPYVTIGGVKYVAATMWPFVAFFSGSFLDANTFTLSAGANGSENVSNNAAVNSWYSVAATTSIEGEFGEVVTANQNSSIGMWICDTTNGKLYSWELTQNNGAPIYQETSWTLAACAGTPSLPSVLVSVVAGTTGPYSHLQLLKTGGNLLARVSFDGGQTYTSFNSTAVGTLSKAGVDLRGSSAFLISGTFVSVAVN